MSLKALSDYVIYSKYAHFLPEEKRRETWEEITDRVFKMHAVKYESELKNNKEFKDLFEKSKQAVKDKRVLGSQRALQFASPDKNFGILKKHEKIYNCCGTLADRPRVFQEIGYVLLNGCGAGYSVQKHHIEKLPNIQQKTNGKKIYKIEDSIEGWSESWGVLINSYFIGGIYPEYEGFEIEFDYSAIRAEGELIAGQFKAPGPKPLEKSHNKIKKIFDKILKDGKNKLSPLNVHDIICHIADSVISGGVRRSSLICLFSVDDEELTTCKTGNWFNENPQRGRANNSVVLERNKTTKEEFDNIFKKVREFGEPGFYFIEDGNKHQVSNPCCEIGFWPVLENGQTGMSFCNLSEINGAAIKNQEDFINACICASFLGTLQAGYNSMPYLGKVTEEIVKKESLIGVSITGWMDNPEILFNEKNLKEGVEVVKKTNEFVAKAIGVNAAARLLTTKPSGSASSLLSCGSGIHAQHSKKFLRRAQVNRREFAGKVIKKKNKIAVQESVWSANKTDNVISFACEAPTNAIVKNDLSSIGFLEKVKFAYQHWVVPGTIKERGLNPFVTHNISVTVNVGDDEWDETRDYIYENRNLFCGISLLSRSGDLDYNQAPFVEILDAKELVERYGAGVPFASGLIVDGLHVFDDLWTACDAALNKINIEGSNNEPDSPKKPRKTKGMTERQHANALANYAIELNLYYQAMGDYKTILLKQDWVRRARQFADRYFAGDIKKMSYCLKHISLLKDYIDIKREWKDIDWSKIKEDEHEYTDIDTLGAIACSGGKCENI